MKKKLIALTGFGLTLAPLWAFAQTATVGCNAAQTGTIEAIICKVGGLLNTLIPIMIVLGVVYFVWGVVQYVISDDEEAKQKGRDRMIWGIIGLVVILSMWGLVGIVTKTFGLSGNVDIPGAPCVPNTPGCDK